MASAYQSRLPSNAPRPYTRSRYGAREGGARNQQTDHDVRRQENLRERVV
jgi:hypothetical protein